MFKSLIFSLGLITSAAFAVDDENLSKTNEMSKPSLLTSFEKVATPINTVSEFENWVQANKKQLGMSDESEIKVIQSTIAENGYSLFRIQQKINDVDIFAHQSVIVLSQGQPISSHLTNTNLPAETMVSMSELNKTVIDTLASEKISYSKELSVTPIFWKQTKKLISAAIVDGRLSQNSADYMYRLIISSSGEILKILPKRLEFEYGLIDVEEMCRIVSYNRPTTAEELLYIADSGYIQNYPPAQSLNQASTDAEQKLAELLNNTSRFMAEQFGNAGIDRADSVSVLAFIGKTFYEDSLSCAGNNHANAFWTELSDELGMMHIHEALLKNPEVLMHELGHGIVAFSSGLVYQSQSGALNEAIGDAFGVGFVAWQNNRMDSPTTTDWELRLINQVIRDFSYPTNVKNIPDHFSDRYTGSQDYGGVHINSSIINHAFYLLSEGGSHRRLGGVNVPKIGMPKALKIWHYAATKILTMTSDFRDARFSFADAAEIIYGKYSVERTAVHQAFDAVGVKGRWTKNVPPKAPPPTTKKVPKSEPKKVPVPAPNTPPEPTLPSKSEYNISILVILVVLLLFLVLVIIIKRSRPGQPTKSAYQDYNVGSAKPSVPFSHSDDSGSKSASDSKTDRTKVYAYFYASGNSYPLFFRDLKDKGVTIGRSTKADICLGHASVSSFHIRLFLKDKVLYLEDLGSSYGTHINGKTINKHQPMKLSDEPIFNLSDLSCRVLDSKLSDSAMVNPIRNDGASLIMKTPHDKFTLDSRKIGEHGITIGRDNECDIVLTHKSVSKFHGRITIVNDQWWYKDLNSTYGSFVKKSGGLDKVEGDFYAQLVDGLILCLADYEIEIHISDGNKPVVL